MGRVRRLMAVSVLFTALAVAVVLGIIAYRFSRQDGSVSLGDVAVTLPPGARLVATNLADDRLALTIEANGATEVWLFDPRSLRPRGRLRLQAAEP